HADCPWASPGGGRVPAAFAPIRYREHLLVDGGITDNVPIDVARSLGAQRLIVVDVSEPLTPEDKLNSPFAIANQMLTAMMKRQADEQITTLRADDVLIHPDLGDLTSTEFPRAMQAVGVGERAALADIGKLRRDAVSDEEYARFAESHHPAPFAPPLVQFLDVVNNRSRTAGYVEQNLTGLTGKPFDADKVDEKIGKAYG